MSHSSSLDPQFTAIFDELCAHLGRKKEVQKETHVHTVVKESLQIGLVEDQSCRTNPAGTWGKVAVFPWSLALMIQLSSTKGAKAILSSFICSYTLLFPSLPALDLLLIGRSRGNNKSDKTNSASGTCPLFTGFAQA